MKEKTPISELKSKAKDELLGNYSIAIGSFVLLFVFIYAVISLLYTGAMSFAFAGRVSSSGVTTDQLEVMLSNDRMSILITLLGYIIMAVAAPFIGIIAVGYTYICREISNGGQPKTSDLFFAIKNHPDKIVIMSLVIYLVSVILRLPAFLYETLFTDGAQTGPQFLTYVIISVVLVIARIIFSIAMSQCYLIYLDNPEASASSCMKGSLRMIKGNMWRYFYMLLTFMGYYILIILSFGIAALWVIPYQSVVMVDFYKDLKERCTVEYRV